MEFNLNSMLIAEEEVSEETETLIHHSWKRLRRLGSLEGVEVSASAGKDAEDPVSSPQPSPRSGSGDLTPPTGDDGDSLSAPSRGGGGEVTQGEPLLQEHVFTAAQAEDVIVESSTAETAEKAAESTPTEDEACDPATVVAREIETSARQTSQELKERRKSAGKVDQKLKDKCLELREWHDKQFKALMRQQDILQMTVHKASLDAREQEISLREENLEAILRAKDESLEALVQQRTKELEDKHGAALDTLATDQAARLKKLVNDLDATSSAKAELDRQVAKLNEDLAESAKKVEALKEEARQAVLHLADVKSQLSSKTQTLETANDNISDMRARIGSLEQLAEYLESRQQLLSKNLENARRLRQDAEDRLKN
nr:myosin heavy chain, striated muscle-like [Aegilops tauschii subsp. strangulata]